jgi:hypothetical protein
MAEIKAFKAFDANLSCRGYRYEIGKTYEHAGPIKLCISGFHACAIPFDCWHQYPGSVTFAQVLLADISHERDGDSKIVGAKIAIEFSLTLPEWIKAQVAAVLDLCRAAKGTLVSEKEQCAAATGDSGHAAATGVSGHAAATGYRGHAAATGKNAIAASLGYQGAAKAGEGGAIVLAFINDDGAIGSIRASKVGENGIKPHVSYRLDADGEFIEAES